jgi:steroid 5-alpha reductase family enzyme
MVEIVFVDLALIFCFMTLLWGLATKWQNVGVVDIGWTLSFTISGLIGFFVGEGLFSKKLILLIMIFCWSLRLAYYLIRRFEKTVEDARYTRIKQNMGRRLIDLKMLAMFLFQSLISFALAVPFLILFEFAESPWSVIEAIGVIIWMVGLAGEALADHQMFEFKLSHKNSSQVCNVGLWKYSRHPNYFFEWVIWIGFGLFILPTSYGWISIFSVAFMFYLLRFYSGVPLSEIQALKTKGDAYKEYQKHTSIFFPWFRT